MSTNERIKHTKSKSIPVPAGRTSGQAVVSGATAGNLQGVLLTSEGALASGGVGNPDGEATVAFDGSFLVPVTTATTGAIGAPVYIIAATHVLTMTSNSGANPLFGFLMEPKAATNPQTVEVLLACQV